MHVTDAVALHFALTPHVTTGAVFTVALYPGKHDTVHTNEMFWPAVQLSDDCAGTEIGGHVCVLLAHCVASGALHVPPLAHVSVGQS
jgi:hypothetical protein